MPQPRSPAADRLWRNWAFGLVLAFVALMSLIAFIVLPVIQGRSAGLDAFSAICRSLGVRAGSPAATQPISVTKAQPVSTVAWTPQVIDRLRHPDLQKGAALAADVCSACHGESGVSPDPQFPHIAGQSAYAIYKQLHDYKNGARVNEMMAGVVKDLTDDQMADVAAHFAALTKGALDPRIASSDDPEVVRLVEYGWTSRGLPACASCHGAHAGGPIDTPTLAGQRKEYLQSQLEAFAKGQRRNDVYERMRSVAAKLREGELEKLADYYSSQHLLPSRASDRRD